MKYSAFIYPNRFFKLILCAGIIIFQVNSLAAQSVKPRIIVTTDITNEPDDQQ